MATLSASLAATAAVPIRSERRGRIQVQKMSAFGGLKAVNNIMAMGCSKNVDQEFAKLQVRCRIAGAEASKSKCGGALALQCSTNVEDFWNAFWWTIGGTLLGVALGFVLIRIEQLYEESLEGEDG